ncbi:MULTISPECIES: expansin EXLX1 family cellulose-binding protein [Flavobacterium]|uniref:Expansin EXLX1 family cellulose-binding protein n=1 Tax=Flavobacterium jumunjinense TaxID=998845 RepID=A0ABV5GJI4_9FLAO|nr:MULTISPECIES: expansin EXLX1 family cellulose-binding protein [Flavobacterium]
MKKLIYTTVTVGLLLLVACSQDDTIMQQDEKATKEENYNFSQKLANIYKNTFNGSATFYTSNGMGNCSEEYPTSQLYAAMNNSQYNNSNACGSYIEVTRKGTNKKVIVKVLDQCTECPYGNVDLSKTAFLKLGTESEGIIPITWKFVKQPNNNKIAVRIKTGSSRYYFSLQILNHRYMVQKVEVKNHLGVYVTIPRQSYNYFLDSNGVFDGNGPDGPYDVRITDVNGSVVNTRINLTINTKITTTVQFPVSN